MLFLYRGWDLAKWLERLTANAKVATVLDSISASSDKVESEGRQMKMNKVHKKLIKNPPPLLFFQLSSTSKLAALHFYPPLPAVEYISS